MKVIVTALHSRIDPVADSLREEAALHGITLLNPMPRKFFAEVERNGKRERWPISREDARRIADEFRWLREEEQFRPGSPDKPLPVFGPLTIDLPEPPREQIAEAQA